MNSDEALKPNKFYLYAADAPPASISHGQGNGIVRVKCATDGCTKQIPIKRSKLKLKRKPRCPQCERKYVLLGATQSSIAAECAAKNLAARQRRLKSLQKA